MIENNPHVILLEDTLNCVGGLQWVEVSYVVPFGFVEVDAHTRKNVTVEELLSMKEAPYSTCVLHILLGCGVSKDVFIAAINKAVSVFERVFVLEHNSVSADWSTEAIRENNFIANCLSASDLLDLCSEHNWRHVQTIEAKGVVDEKRNLIVELEGKSLKYSESLPRIREHAASFENLRDVYLGNADAVSLLPALYDKLKEVKKELIPKSNVYASIGGFFSLNLIRGLLFDTVPEIKSLTFFDKNPYSVKFCESLINIILHSESRKDFLENYLLLPVTSVDGQFKFLPASTTARSALFHKNAGHYSKDVFPIFELIMQSPYDSEKLYVNGLMHLGGVDLGYLYLQAGVDNYAHFNAIETGFGWLESEESFLVVKDLLRSLRKQRRLKFVNKRIEDLSPKPDDLLLASNVLRWTNKSFFDYLCPVISHG